MSNPIKVSTSSTDFPALKLRDFENINRFIYVGSRLYPYGPSDSSGFYAGVTPQEGKYVIYKVTGNDTFLIYAPANDLELELATKQLYPGAWNIAPLSLELVKQIIHQNLFNRDYENIILSGLTFAMDSSFWPSVCSNTTIKDISKNNLTIVSSLTYNSGSTFDNASIELDGTDDFLSANIPANSNSSEGNTFEFWIFKPESSGLQNLLSFFGYNLSISFSGGTFGLYNGNNSFYGLNFSNFSNWTHCVFYIPNNWSTNYSNTKIWINGIEQTITVDTGNYQSVNFGTTLICYFGKGFYSTLNIYYYLGSLSVIRSYDRELTNDEVVHNFNEQKTRYGFPPEVVTDGLVFAVDAGNTNSYPGSGTVWDDMVGGNNGTLVNGPTFDSGNGGSIVFDGSDDYVSFGNILNDVLAGTGNKFTLCSWCNKNNSSTFGPLIAKSADSGMGANERHLALNFRNNRLDLVLLETPDNTGWVRVVQNTSDLEYGVWYFICATYDGSISSTNILDKVKLYINGSEVSTFVYYSSGTLNSTLDGSNAPLSIGMGVSAAGNSNYPFPGKISNSQIYNRALTPQEITQNYNALKGRYGFYEDVVMDGLVFAVDAGNTYSYPGSGTTWTDLIGDNDGTLTNGPTFDSANGGSIVFDGSDDYVGFGNSPNLNNTSITVSVWCKFSGSLDSNDRKIFCYKKTTGTPSQAVCQIRKGDNNNRIKYQFNNNGTWYTLDLDNAMNLSNTWYNYTIVHAGNNVKAYINGSFYEEDNFEANIDYSNRDKIVIGYRANSEYWKGNISNLNFYNRALSANEVLQNYNALKERYGY